jgi:hypothetical protein
MLYASVFVRFWEVAPNRSAYVVCLQAWITLWSTMVTMLTINCGIPRTMHSCTVYVFRVIVRANRVYFAAVRESWMAFAGKKTVRFVTPLCATLPTGPSLCISALFLDGLRGKRNFKFTSKGKVFRLWIYFLHLTFTLRYVVNRGNSIVNYRLLQRPRL